MNLGAQVSVPQLVERARAEKADAVLVSQVVTQRDAHLLNTREMSAAFREAYPADRRPLLVVGGPRFDEAMAGELGVDRVFTRGTTPGEVASFLVHRLAPTEAADDSRMTAEVGTTVDAPPLRAVLRTPTTPATWSTAPTASALFGDVATELCIRTDGDEGLFASYSDVQFLAPVRAGDVLEVGLHAGPGRHPVAGDRVRRARGGARGADRTRPGAAGVLDPPLLATTATGTVVVPPSDWLRPCAPVGPPATRRAEPRELSVNVRVNGAWPLTCAFSRSRRSAGG